MANKRAFVIHGWMGTAHDGWFPWLKERLEDAGFDVLLLEMPDNENPRIEPWVARLAGAVGEADEETYFVGHSVGGQTILRYLAGLGGRKVGGVVCVATWFPIMNLKEESDIATARPWTETPMDFAAVLQATDNITAVFSDNDPWVPLDENKRIFEEKLKAKVIVEKGKGHLTGSDGIDELPCVLEAVCR